MLEHSATDSCTESTKKSSPFYPIISIEKVKIYNFNLN